MQWEQNLDELVEREGLISSISLFSNFLHYFHEAHASPGPAQRLDVANIILSAFPLGIAQVLVTLPAFSLHAQGPDGNLCHPCTL